MERLHRSLKSFAITFTIILMSMFNYQEAPALSDATIKKRIEAQAASTSGLKGAQVSVYVDERQVVLSGSVRLYAQKMTYERIAWQTMGVAEVDNEIRDR